MTNLADHITLYSYWRSSASYRVRIALALKGLRYAYRAVDLTGERPENWRPDYRAVNPQGLVPTLIHGRFTITQSLAIIDYLDALVPQPALLPHDPQVRARSLALAQLIACEVHPLQNPMVCDYLRREHGADADQLRRWRRHWIEQGLAAFERHLAHGSRTAFAAGDAPSVADICLIPQLYNARRFECALDAFPQLVDIESRCLELEAFRRAAPEMQPDAPG